MRYRLKVKGQEYLIGSPQELKQRLSFARGQVFTDLELTQLHFPPRKPKLITRLLAPVMKWDLGLLNEENMLSGLIQGDQAVLFYLESRGEGFHSINPDYLGSEEEVIEFYVSTGEKIRHPRKWAVSAEKAIDTFLQFYEYGKRPGAIQWAIIDRESE